MEIEKETFDALVRVAATSWPRRDLDAEQVILDAIQRRDEKIAQLLPIVELVAKGELILMLQPAGYVILKCPTCDAQIGDIDHPVVSPDLRDYYSPVRQAAERELEHETSCPVTAARALAK